MQATVDRQALAQLSVQELAQIEACPEAFRDHFRHVMMIRHGIPDVVLERTDLCAECEANWFLHGGRIFCMTRKAYLTQCPAGSCDSRIQTVKARGGA
jgi:hypothetical protein